MISWTWPFDDPGASDPDYRLSDYALNHVDPMRMLMPARSIWQISMCTLQNAILTGDVILG